MAELDNIAPGGVIQLDKAPAALDDATFDSLFPADGKSVTIAPAQQTQAQTGQQQTQTTQQTQTPATTQQTNDFFLKGDRSVYKSAEEAIKGVNEKDALIDTLRQRYALTTGIDPITGQPITQVQQPQELDYTRDRKRYLEDLYAAAKTSPDAYGDVQEKFVKDIMKPYQPLIQKLAREQALSTAAVENPTIPQFVGTTAYQKALEGNPELAGAIATGETDQRFHSRLPGLYKLAYLASQGMQVPDLLRAQTTTQQTVQHTQTTQSTPAPVRTTTQQTTPAQARETPRPSFKTIDGIKSIIAQAEAAGAKLDF